MNICGAQPDVTLLSDELNTELKLPHPGTIES